MKVTSAQFSIRPLNSREEFWSRIEIRLKEAQGAGSDLIVFPEYFSLSWYLFGESGNFRECILKNASLQEEFVTRFQLLCDKFKIAVVAGTNPFVEGNRIFNRSWIFRMNEAPLFQDKVNMTRFEAGEWNIQSGEKRFQSFQVKNTLCGVAICYDSEFPSYTASPAREGVEVLCVPTCTDDVYGYWRVRHCSQARTIENQCFVMTSSLVGGNPDWPEISYHYGAGLVACPSDIGFPAGGVLAESKPNEEMSVHAELDLKQLVEIRKNGTVLNLRDAMNTRKS